VRAGVVALVVLAAAGAVLGATVPAASAVAGRRNTARGEAPPPRFRLAPTYRARVAVGSVVLTPSASPFGLAVSRDGTFNYDLDIQADDLPSASSLGAYSTYEAWVATPKLDMVRALGVVENGHVLHAHADWNKFTVFVTAEAPPIGKKWSGAVVLVGRSPSSLMQSFAGHPFYNTGQAPF
jgi:hypothetical protein